MKQGFLMVMIFTVAPCMGQSKVDLGEYSFQVEGLNDQLFLNFTSKKLKNTQFTFIGEQHGIKEVGHFTNAVYDLALSQGYHTLCIETDAIAAKTIYDLASSDNTLNRAQKLSNEFPYSIPFYENKDDYALFKNVVTKDGDIWGIDQTFMTQFRLNFDYLMKTTSNTGFKNKLKINKKEAINFFNKALESKETSTLLAFGYDSAQHKELLSLAGTDMEREVLNQLWKSKEIYEYYASRKTYHNNQTRGALMKRNFMSYYNATKNQKTKVLFKLGGFHAAKGLTRTNIYDIGNFGHELAASNGYESLHFLVFGISGQAATGSPFAPSKTVDFNSIKQFPKEIQDIVPNISKQYYILDLVPLRSMAYGNGFTDSFKSILFGYDVLVLINKASALETFN